MRTSLSYYLDRNHSKSSRSLVETLQTSFSVYNYFISKIKCSLVSNKHFKNAQIKLFSPKKLSKTVQFSAVSTQKIRN